MRHFFVVNSLPNELQSKFQGQGYFGYLTRYARNLHLRAERSKKSYIFFPSGKRQKGKYSSQISQSIVGNVILLLGFKSLSKMMTFATIL